MIQLENVSKFYPTRTGRHFVLNDVSVTLPDRAKVGVVGRNGAGKSTLMRLLAGVDVPSGGKIRRTGTISWPMGLVSGLQGSMTGRENARFSCRIQGVQLADIPAKIDEIEEFAEIGKYFDMPVNTYSSGMRARVQFGITMAFDFDCYILDEITAVGDRQFRQKSKAVFDSKRQGASFIRVSHSFQELLSECDMGLLLDQGKLTLFDDIGEAIAVYNRLTGDDDVTPGWTLSGQVIDGGARLARTGIPTVTVAPVNVAKLVGRGKAAMAEISRFWSPPPPEPDPETAGSPDKPAPAQRGRRKKNKVH